MSKLITPEFRGSFVALAAPRGIKGDANSTPKYQLTIALPKDDPFWKEARALAEAAGVAKLGKIPPKFKWPIKDGDESGYDNLEGMFMAGASSVRRPGIVDAQLKPIVDGDELYSGAWYRASIRSYAWAHPTGGKGASFALDNVMKVRDDDAFDGSVGAETDFADFASKSDSDSLLD